MISDESSSDSETGRFKSGTSKQNDTSRTTQIKDRTDIRAFDRSRPDGNRSHRREYDGRRDNRDRNDQRSKDRGRFSKYSPVRHHSRDRSYGSSRRRSRERIDKPRESSSQQKPRDRRSKSRDKKRSSLTKSLEKSPERKKYHRDEIPKISRERSIQKEKSRERSIQKEKSRERSSQKRSPSPIYKGKRSVVQKPPPKSPPKRKSRSPIELEVIDSEDDIQVEPGSYYSMVPSVVKEKDKHETKPKADESSEIDSSDDERLRAKLLNLEKELKQTRKKKHKKRHKSKSSKLTKDKDDDSDAPVEVTSTTDIQEKADASLESTNVKVSSTQRGHKDCSEEGEISSEDNTLSSIEIDSNDLRHRLKRTVKTKPSGSPDLREALKSRDVCGPALPPHLERSSRETTSVDIEGPALPPTMRKTERVLGPSIPSDLRSALSQRDVTYESSDDDAIGPLPVGAESKWTAAHKHLEERAMGMKIKKLGGDDSTEVNIKAREAWMLELPEAKAKILGLEARSFRAKEGPDMSDRSSWTDTPEERARKAAGKPDGKEPAEVDLKREAETRIIEIHDDEQEKAVKKHKKKHKREESLLELHQKKIKKKKKKEDKDDKKERRPFSRDTDLQVNRFDDAQKRSIIKKAQELDTRFGRGEAKYL